MKNKIIICTLALGLCLGFCGCQLALEEGQTEKRDRLIGCYITTEHLDLFDFEAYFNDNASELINGGNVVLEGDTSAYQGRIYAEYYEETLTSDEGESHTTGNYRFTELEGIGYYAPTITEPDGDSYVTFYTDEGLNEVENKMKSFGVENYYTELSAKIYANIDGENEFLGNELVFYMNLVYQSPDGSVYLVSSNGGSAMNLVYPGTFLTTTISEETTANINGEEFVGGSSVSIEYAAAYAAEEVLITEMNSGSEVVAEARFDIGKLPDSYTPREETAYIILTALCGEHTERSIVAPGTENEDIFALTEAEGGWLRNVYCEVLWKEDVQ